MSKKENNKTIAVVGLGYVGLPLALLSDKKGYKVIGIDINSEAIRLINKRSSPFLDEYIALDLKTSSILATTDFKKIKDASIVIICVPTPVYEDHMPNLEPVKNAARSIGQFLQKDQLVILESTVNPGVTRNIILPILENESGLKCGEDFYLAHCPERINPGDKKWNVTNIPRVTGGFNETSLDKTVKFYESIITGGVKPMATLEEAEAVKIIENTFRDINIAFVNELAMSFAKLNINVVNVIDGAATKPFAFMPHYPGAGVGGHCIPVDPYYLIDHAKQNGFNHKFLSLAREINNGMPEFVVDLAKKALKEKKVNIKGARVAVLGLAYKAEIDDCRESPSFKIIESLEGTGAKVVVFDPFVLSKSSAKSLEEALERADAVILATAHNIFKKISPRDLAKHGVKVLIDGRNCLTKEEFTEAGIIYKGIGR